MLSDRSYMRAGPGRNPPSALAWFLGILVGVFVLQKVAEIWFPQFGARFLFDYGALSSGGIRHGYLWTLFTYALLHGSVTHLLLNGLGLFLFGRELETILGRTRFVKLLVATALGGALFWLGVYFQRRGTVIGASGILMGMVTVAVCLDPRRLITSLFIPIGIQARWFLAIFGGIDVLGLVFYELPGRGTLYGVAHSAHLGGLVAGWIFYQLALARRLPFLSAPSAAIEPPAWFQRRAARPTPAYTVNLDAPASARPASVATSRDTLRAEVDRILDKINLHGFGALTAEEKRVLDEARQHLNPR